MYFHTALLYVSICATFAGANVDGANAYTLANDNAESKDGWFSSSNSE